ncbi:hypothetical protein [Schlesneria sp. T3-172]|uniref:hypothetical protein n=1 Tax=Schlesneria sphaerica TaxID=3373610 RepID=UPI0037C740A3
MCSYVPDGYTRDGYIAPSVHEADAESLHGELDFTYRPATRLDVVKIDAEIRIAVRNQDFDPLCAVRAEQLACKFVADRVIAWSLRDQGESPVRVSAEACERMQPFLFSRLYNIIRGVQANDLRPNQVPPPSEDDQLKN